MPYNRKSNVLSASLNKTFPFPEWSLTISLTLYNCKVKCVKVDHYIQKTHKIPFPSSLAGVTGKILVLTTRLQPQSLRCHVIDQPMGQCIDSIGFVLARLSAESAECWSNYWARNV